MTEAPWLLIVAVTLAVLLLLAAALGRAILAWFGFEIERISATRSAHEELRGTLEELHREGAVVKADRVTDGSLPSLNSASSAQTSCW